MRIFSKDTGTFDLGEFNRYVDVIKQILVARFYQQAVEAASDIPKESMDNYNSLCVAYWFGEDLDKVAETLAGDKEEIEEFIDLIPDKSHDALAVNQELRQVVVYVLWFKAQLNEQEYGKSWLKSSEYKRISSMLDAYGGEFPSNITAKRFIKMVHNMNKYYSFKQSTS